MKKLTNWLSLFAALLAVGAVVALASRLRRGDVRPDDLARLLDQADKLVVLEGPREGADVLFESSDRRDLDTLKTALQVERPDRYIHCMCDGTPAIVLYANDERIGQITNHHAKVIRCSLWASDAPLVDAEALLQWFDDRGIAGPRKEYDRARQQEREWREAERKWVAAMPPALRPLWPETVRRLDPALPPLRRALEEGIPDKNERILALFAWYGSGMGLWSGYPSYEDVAEKLLLDYSTRELLAAIDGRQLSTAQTEGVARLFAGWTFSQLRPDDVAHLRTRASSEGVIGRQARKGRLPR